MSKPHDEGRMCNCAKCEPKLHKLLSNLIPEGVKLMPMTKFEMHADGVKELDECPFCTVPCNEPHCPYTKDEE
jgi:hypothetical protein